MTIKTFVRGSDDLDWRATEGPAAYPWLPFAQANLKNNKGSQMRFLERDGDCLTVTRAWNATNKLIEFRGVATTDAIH